MPASRSAGSISAAAANEPRSSTLTATRTPNNRTRTGNEENASHAHCLKDHAAQVRLEQEQRDQYRDEVIEHEIEGRRRVRNDAQVGRSNSRKDSDHGAGQVRTDTCAFGEKCRTRDDEQHRHQGKIVVSAE